MFQFRFWIFLCCLSVIHAWSNSSNAVDNFDWTEYLEQDNGRLNAQVIDITGEIEGWNAADDLYVMYSMFDQKTYSYKLRVFQPEEPKQEGKGTTNWKWLNIVPNGGDRIGFSKSRNLRTNESSLGADPASCTGMVRRALLIAKHRLVVLSYFNECVEIMHIDPLTYKGLVLQQITSPGQNPALKGALFGFSIAFDDPYLVVGAPDEYLVGHVYVFRLYDKPEYGKVFEYYSQTGPHKGQGETHPIGSTGVAVAVDVKSNSFAMLQYVIESGMTRAAAPIQVWPLDSKGGYSYAQPCYGARPTDSIEFVTGGSYVLDDPFINMKSFDNVDGVKIALSYGVQNYQSKKASMRLSMCGNNCGDHHFKGYSDQQHDFCPTNAIDGVTTKLSSKFVISELYDSQGGNPLALNLFINPPDNHNVQMVQFHDRNYEQTAIPYPDGMAEHLGCKISEGKYHFIMSDSGEGQSVVKKRHTVFPPITKSMWFEIELATEITDGDRADIRAMTGDQNRLAIMYMSGGREMIEMFHFETNGEEEEPKWQWIPMTETFPTPVASGGGKFESFSIWQEGLVFVYATHDFFFIYEFDLETNKWVYDSKNPSCKVKIANSGDRKILVRNGFIVVGTSGSGEAPGQVTVYNYDSNQNCRVYNPQTFGSDVPVSGDGFGTSLSIVDQVLFVGFPNKGTGYVGVVPLRNKGMKVVQVLNWFSDKTNQYGISLHAIHYPDINGKVNLIVGSNKIGAEVPITLYELDDFDPNVGFKNVVPHALHGASYLNNDGVVYGNEVRLATFPYTKDDWKNNITQLVAFTNMNGWGTMICDLDSDNKPFIPPPRGAMGYYVLSDERPQDPEPRIIKSIEKGTVEHPDDAYTYHFGEWFVVAPHGLMVLENVCDGKTDPCTVKKATQLGHAGHPKAPTPPPTITPAPHGGYTPAPTPVHTTSTPSPKPSPTDSPTDPQDSLDIASLTGMLFIGMLVVSVLACYVSDRYQGHHKRSHRSGGGSKTKKKQKQWGFFKSKKSAMSTHESESTHESTHESESAPAKRTPPPRPISKPNTSTTSKPPPPIPPPRVNKPQAQEKPQEEQATQDKKSTSARKRFF